MYSLGSHLIPPYLQVFLCIGFLTRLTWQSKVIFFSLLQLHSITSQDKYYSINIYREKKISWEKMFCIGTHILATWCEELTHLSNPWCWERLRARGEGDNREWDGWMPSLTQWTWVWVNFRSWWWTGRPGVLWSMGSQWVGHNWATELNWTE